MKRTLQLIAFLMFSMTAVSWAQNVTGTVSDASDGTTLPGVNVVAKGTSVGVTTDFDGNYEIEMPEGATILEFSFMGYVTQAVDISGKTNVDVALQVDAKSLDEVVVTALGIEKKAKGLTYSTQQVNGDELTRTKDANMMNTLAGKTAGVQITRSSSGVGGSTKVTIRGNKSATGTNQPLYVIDGIPMINNSADQPSTTFGGSNDAGGRDAGDGISNLNPDDIKSMSVLKGPAAAALYGSQAANGVIVITTKKGVSGRTDVNFSSNLTFDNVITVPEFQNSYEGALGGSSWGAKTNNSGYNPEDFFQTGVTAINSLSVSKGGEKTQTYFSYANTSNKGVVENSGLNKHNFNIRATTKLSDKLTIDGNINALSQKMENRPVAGGMYFNPLTGLYKFARGNDISDYRNNYAVYSTDRNMPVQNWHSGLGDMDQNPWWLTNKYFSTDKRTRFITNLTLKYEFNEFLNIQARGNMDFISDRYENGAWATTAPALAGENGRYIHFTDRQTLLYSDVLLNFNKTWGDVGVVASVGTSINDYQQDALRQDSHPTGLNMANVFNMANITNPYVEETKLHTQEQSVFATAQVSYKDYLFFDVTARNDWSSSLAYTNSMESGFFYPSVGLTAVVSDMIKMPESVSMVKLRGALSSVGNDIPPYVSRKQRDIINGNLNNVLYQPFEDLKPEITNSLEFGGEFGMFDNRISLDLTWYKTNTINQFFQLPAPAGSGYSFYFVNAGNIENKGLEVILGITPVASEDFYWNTTFNYSSNKNTVLELHEDLPAFSFGNPGSNSYWMQMEEGGSYGDIYGIKFQRDDAGKIMFDNETGLPLKGTDFEYIGNPNPKFNIGWSNSFNFRNFNLNFLIDARIGGDVISITQAEIDLYGTSKASADARDKGYVMLEGTKVTDVQGFYETVGGRAGVTEYYSYSGTNIRLRELSFGYTLPKEVSKKTGFMKGASFSIVARNLFFLYNEAPFDPDASYSTGNGLQGVDVYGMPSTRSIGANLKVNF